MKIPNVMSALLIFVLISTLFSGIYISFNENYGVIDTNTKEINGTTGTISQHFFLLGVNIRQGVAGITSSIEKVTTSNNPIDVLGGLAALGFGIAQTVWGIFRLPAEILNIVIIFIPFPPIIIDTLTATLLVYLGFIIMRVLTKEDL